MHLNEKKFDGITGRNFTFTTLVWLCLCCCCCCSAGASESEYYSSVAGLETLLKTEQILVADLKLYVKTTKESIDVLEKEIIKIEKEHALAAADTENYLTNPVNAYKLMKRLYNDWHKYEEEHFSKNNESLKHLTAKRHQLDFPTRTDFEESALSLVRLQKTYNLDVAQVASGILNGIKYGTDMSWSDCLLLGQQLINVRAYNETKAWIKESVKRYNFEAPPTVNGHSLDFLEKLGENLMKTGDTEAALKIFRSIVVKDPSRLSAVANIYENTYILPDNYDEEREYHKSEEFKLYEKVCREEVTRSPAEVRHLRCRYHWGQDNARCLSPYKVEELNNDPYIMLFHDIVSPQQMEKIKEIALPSMERSMVRDDGGGASKKRNYRISKNTWVPYESHRYAMKLLRDLQYVTGLDTSNSEQLQVANYGPGGHYEPHVDFALTGVTADLSNRISTSIFYLSDVEQGGATAFPYLKIAVKPIKGTVLFWYNLHRSLDGDYRTKHAGCPVLKGSKWIANVWTHDRLQIVARPCGLYRDHESSLDYEIVK